MTMYAVIGVVIIIVVAVLGLYLGGYLGGGGGTTAQITIADDSVCTTNSAACHFSPVSWPDSSHTVHTGDTVTWKNNGGVAHTVTFTSSASPLDQTILAGKTGSVTFSATGTFQYKCTIHPWMTGNVTVT
jgi:plastocyanin